MKRVVAVFSIAVLSGCATAWQDNGVFYRKVQTDLRLEGELPSRVDINRVYKGESPGTFLLVYEQEVRKKTRKVSYWISQPQLAFLLTILSLGIYLPFSVIPVDIESIKEPADVFRGNHFVVRVTDQSHQGWEEEIIPIGEKEIVRNVTVIDE